MLVGGGHILYSYYTVENTTSMETGVEIKDEE